ncbi:ComEA family DNA-binding protein [Arthrobacter sp. PAMC25284]|uniref:ComEA family DNA-binding protein n=1 Tax=Arthrobacter sp. PAMC25284 TaxID=2861279 RepID=UPI002158F46A|nr:ComEA family DNA-binding protein [Arthrobacter sp. PAMC25284]
MELPAGSRLFEAIAAAGGGTDVADPARLNLAAVLADGQKVIVPALGEPDQAYTPPDGTAGSGMKPDAGGQLPGSGKINLNTADVAELGTLPRVGPVLAQRIVDWRQQHGRFTSVEELDAVEGVGPKMLAALRPLVAI